MCLNNVYRIVEKTYFDDRLSVVASQIDLTKPIGKEKLLVKFFTTQEKSLTKQVYFCSTVSV